MSTFDDNRLTAEDLLASPRGRSLVLGLANRPPDDLADEFDEDGEPLTTAARNFSELGDAIFVTSYLLEKEVGSGAVMYLGDGMVEPAPGSVTVADVAEGLRQVPPSVPNQDDIERELADVVESAMYWQPPHGDQHIADALEVRAALMPFAEEVVATGLLDTWSRSLDSEHQWALAWDSSELHGALPPLFDEPLGDVDASRTIVLEDLDPVDDELGCRLPQGLDEWVADMLTSESDRRDDFEKNPYDEVSSRWWSIPPSGLWSSTGTRADGTPIGLELVEDSLGLERARACRLRIRPDASICEIHHPEDWAELCRRYPLDVTAAQRSDWFAATGRRGRWVIPDWSQVAEEFDGVHVSLAGYLRTAGAVIEVGAGGLVDDSPTLPTFGNTDEVTASLMAGWNPDMTYWLNDVITGVAEVVEWCCDNDAGAWRRV